jgi:hypothetical protein
VKTLRSESNCHCPSLPITVILPPGDIRKTGREVKIPFSIASQENCPVGALSETSERLQARLKNAHKNMIMSSKLCFFIAFLR